MVATNFIDHKISTRVSREFTRVVTGKTDIVTMASGRERRNAAWKFKKMKFTAIYLALTEESQQEIMSAYFACNGMLWLFRFRDYGDYHVDDSPVDPTGFIGTRTPMQLYKRYTFGPATADRMVQAVSTCVVKNAEGGVVPGVFDTALGTFTPSSPWENTTYTWTGTFDLWVRFANDDLDVTMINLDMATPDIELIESIAYAA